MQCRTFHLSRDGNRRQHIMQGRRKANKKHMTNTYLTWIISKPSFTSFGKSSASFRLEAGNRTVLTPARRAPISFSLIPPTAVTFPRSDISPVMAIVGGTALPENRDMRAIVWAIPADGPSFWRLVSCLLSDIFRVDLVLQGWHQMGNGRGWIGFS